MRSRGGAFWSAALRGFFRANVRACDAIESLLPRSFNRSLLALHENRAAEEMNRRDGQIVVDIGGGHLCPFARHRQAGRGTILLALDILESQLRRNLVTDWRLAADACRTLPLADRSVDVIVTRSVLEHLRENEPFVRECHRILRPGGRCVHVMPARYAPFAILNRLIPERIGQKLLFYFFPEWKEECGFHAYYANCYHPRIEELFSASGFHVQEVQFRFYQSIYYKFFVPFYLVSLGYDFAVWAIGARRLACQILLIAEKRP